MKNELIYMMKFKLREFYDKNNNNVCDWIM